MEYSIYKTISLLNIVTIEIYSLGRVPKSPILIGLEYSLLASQRG